MLDASLNEVEALTAKAARGAGLPWGLAEDAAYAARWLASFGWPWAGPLLGLLSTFAPRPIATDSAAGETALSDPEGGAMSPLLCGPALADRAADMPAGSVRLILVAEPLWILPFAAQVSLATRRNVQVRVGPVRVTVARHRCWAAAGGLDDVAGGRADVICALAPAPSGTAERSRSDRAQVAPGMWDRLAALAARTYVPASASSRARGAGAGLEVDD